MEEFTFGEFDIHTLNDKVLPQKRRKITKQFVSRPQMNDEDYKELQKWIISEEIESQQLVIGNTKLTKKDL